MKTTHSMRATVALFAAFACVAVDAQTVPAVPCVAGQKIAVKAAATTANQQANNDAMSQLQSQMQKDAMACVKRVKDAIAAASIHTIDISSILSQIESQLAAKACNVVMTTVNNDLNKVTQPINGAVDGSVNGINSGINKTVGGSLGTTGLTGVSTSGSVPVTGGPTTVSPQSVQSPTATTSTWNKLSCAFGGSCGN